MTWEDCLMCVNRKSSYTCPATMCKLDKREPCLSCAAQKESKKYLFYCKEFALSDAIHTCTDPDCLICNPGKIL